MENFTRKVKKIKRISNISNRDVYDITVNKNHNFFANSVLVHNCVEIGMYAYDESGESGFEFCVKGDTKLITKDGIEEIKKVVGKEVEIWNGFDWKKVKPFQTGTNQDFYRVYMDDGSYLDCTSQHKFLVKDRFSNSFEEITTVDLLEKLSKHKYKLHVPSSNVKYNDGKEKPYAYDYGFVLGDGNVECYNKENGEISFYDPRANLFGEDHNLKLNVIRHKKSTNSRGTEFTPVTFQGLDNKFAFDLKYSKGLPKEVFTWDRNSIKEFVAGWIDSDGTQQGRGFRIYGKEDKVRDLQLLLTKIGVRSSVNVMSLKGEETNLGERKNDVWYAQVSDTQDLFCYKFQMLCEERKNEGKGSNQTINKVVKLDEKYDSFCLTEEDKHTCLFNNIITKQCNLCEINGKKATNEKDFYDMCRAAAIIGTIQASYATFDYLSKSTERIVQREALLGVSMTGMMDNPHITFDKEIQRKGAKLILDVNEEIALKIGVNKCARSTCVKPAGCLDANTSIRTKHGKKTLIEIFEEQGYSYDEIKDLSDTWLELKKPIQIFNENNELENVSKLYVNGKIKTYEIPLEDGSIIKSTPWHKFKLYNGEWKRADELKEGDDILEYNKNYVYADYIPKHLV